VAREHTAHHIGRLYHGDVTDGAGMTDFVNSHSADELRTDDVEQFTLSRERMRRMRVALVAEMRTTTPADPKGNRKMLHGALSLLAPDSSLRRKLARCGKRDPANDSRWFCRRPSCGVCMSRQAKWLCKTHLWPSLQTTPPTQLRWITILTHQCSDLDYGAAGMQRQHRRLQRILAKFAISNGKDRTDHLRVWGAREVERIDDGWQFHVHMLVDLSVLMGMPWRRASELHGAAIVRCRPSSWSNAIIMPT
jgi:hypothetical protein